MSGLTIRMMPAIASFIGEIFSEVLALERAPRLLAALALDALALETLALVLVRVLLGVLRQRTGRHAGRDAELLGDARLREARVEERGEVGRLEGFLLAAPFPSRHFRSASNCHGLNTRHAE